MVANSSTFLNREFGQLPPSLNLDSFSIIMKNLACQKWHYRTDFQGWFIKSQYISVCFDRPLGLGILSCCNDRFDQPDFRSLLTHFKKAQSGGPRWSQPSVPTSLWNLKTILDLTDGSYRPIHQMNITSGSYPWHM